MTQHTANEAESKIVVTPEMIAAGVNTLALYSTAEDSLHDIAMAVFIAMATASQPCDRSRANRAIRSSSERG